MAGQIFFRERQKVKDGAKSPRYRIIAVNDVNLKVYGNHLRMTEIAQIAEATGADLVQLKRGSKHR